MARDDVPNPEERKGKGQPEEASTVVGLVLAAFVLAIFGVFFVDALEAQGDRPRPKEAPRVEGQLAPIGQSATIAVIAADDETDARKRDERKKQKGKERLPPVDGAEPLESAEPHAAREPKSSGNKAAKPRPEPAGSER